VLKGQPIAQGDLGTVVPELLPLLSKENLLMPKGAHTLFSSYENENGTFLTVQMFIAPGFSMPNETVVESVPEGVDAKVMQYGVQLSGAVRASVMSWSGKLVVPGFSFTAP
jgi:hypothetical protein